LLIFVYPVIPKGIRMQFVQNNCTTRLYSHKIRSDAGFTLIELMITVAFFVGGMVAVLSSLTGMIRQQQYADMESVTSTYMEYLLNDLQRELTTLTSGNDPTDINDVSNYVNGTYGNFFVDDPVPITLVGLERPATANMKLVGPQVNPVEVEVNITVLDHSGRSVRYSTSRMIRWSVE
jgi:type II secretory pathway pseudopilin PulG